ncbi:YhdP family protein [Stenotrophomonas sp. SY1]|uniref:YhdP family protein n=1 Tax=Stenotrophomonas sp. SY1 TaxID=477235 RepID=UPI001E632089|nr:TIGR02099 family protein [Stenotrophomonas sp. SY1]
MTTLLRHRLRRFRRYVLLALALLLVGVALLVGTISQLLPMVEAHPDKVAAWLSARAGLPVAFDKLDTRWTRRGPLLQLDGLRVGQGDGVRVGQAEVLVALYSGLLPGAPLTELRLRGLTLTLQRAEDGRWSVRGLPPTQSGGDPLDTLRRLGELQVIGGQLQVQAPSIGMQTRIPRVDLRLRVDGQRLRVGAKGWIDTAAPPLVAVLDFERARGDGQAWLAAEPADLAAWSPLLRVAGVQARQGKGEISGWVQLRDHRVVAITADGELENVQLAGAALAGDTDVPTASFNSLQLRARWKATDDGWRLDAPRLRISDGSGTQTLDGLLLAGGKHFALQGKQLDGGLLLQVAALSDRLEPGLRRWLHQSRPTLRLADVTIAGTPDGPLRARGELLDASFAPVGRSPGLSGLHGHFEGDAQAVSLGLRPDQPVRFDWPTGFGVLHELRLSGQLVGWREGAGWQFGTPALRVQGIDYAADVRGGLWFQGDGTRPWINLAAKIDDVPLTAAKGFWVRSSMSQAAVDWLDAALVGGTLRGGTGLAVGDLDDWPFKGNNGRFEAGGRISDGSIHFHHDWPVMRHVDADINFIANGFDLHGKGELAAVKVDKLQAGIADFGESRLRVQATTQDDAGRLLAMLRQSPLQASYGDTLNNLVVTGPVAVNFDLLLPLRRGEGAGHLKGDVDLRGARLADKRWDIQFDNVFGKAQYSGGGFDAPALQVRHQERDGVLALRAGEQARDPANAFEAELTAALEAGKLLDRAPELAWLKPYVHGTSAWTVGVTLPKAATGSRAVPPTLLTLRSDLQGTRLQLPAPLDKPAADPLPTRVQAALPMGAGRIDVAFGKLMALAARSQNGKTGVQVTMGSDQVDHEPPADGLMVNGRTPTLDALEWIGLARGGDTKGEGGVSLKQMDVLADQLLLIGGRFAQTRLQLRPGAEATAVQLSGPALSGSLHVPSADGGTVSGQLDRVHWQPAKAATVESSDTPLEPMNPARIPPLALDIEDLAFGAVKLGQTRLRTRPLADGLQVQELQIRAPKQHIEVQGQWRGIGAQATTQASTNVQTEDLGDLLERLGYGGQLRGGQGQMQLQAGWSGTPMAFSLANLEGGLSMNVRNGQLLEVEPGAGRVLGLLSVAQLPRRLLFDFRDLFSKGLAFNQVEGQVRFGGGQASTDKILIESSAADITIRGQADLRAQQFNQTIDVNPRSGNLLTVVGAVAGGPVGAAVGAAANAVLGKPLGEIGAKTYKVTGPWKDPKVEVIDRDTVRTPPPVVVPDTTNP